MTRCPGGEMEKEAAVASAEVRNSRRLKLFHWPIEFSSTERFKISIEMFFACREFTAGLPQCLRVFLSRSALHALHRHRVDSRALRDAPPARRSPILLALAI